jgi:hypothetical protein
MARTALIAGAAAALAAAQPAAAIVVPSAAQVRAQIVESTSLFVVQGSPVVVVIVPMGMPTVRGSTTGALFVGNTPSMGMGGMPMIGLERLTVRRDTSESAAVTAPGSFTVMRMKGADSMTVKTNPSAEFGVMGDGVLMGGALMGGWASSVDVGRQVWTATATPTAPTLGQPTLVVTVQYN